MSLPTKCYLCGGDINNNWREYFTGIFQLEWICGPCDDALTRVSLIVMIEKIDFNMWKIGEV